MAMNGTSHAETQTSSGRAIICDSEPADDRLFANVTVAVQDGDYADYSYAIVKFAPTIADLVTADAHTYGRTSVERN
jgi:hypothetical protein